MRRELVAFARHAKQPLRDVIEWWHPRDIETWIEMDMAAAEDGRFAALREEHREAQGR